MAKRCTCIFILVVIFFLQASGLHASHYEEKAFCGISSLLFYLEEFGNNPTGKASIQFSKDDIAMLWTLALLDSDAQKRVFLAKKHYEDALKNNKKRKSLSLKASQILKGIWKKLDDQLILDESPVFIPSFHQRPVPEKKIAYQAPKKERFEAVGYHNATKPSTVLALDHSPKDVSEITPNPFRYNNVVHITPKMYRKMHPYILPLRHPMKPALDSIFGGDRVLLDENCFSEADFEAFPVNSKSNIRVARHKKLPGYVLKVYLDSDTGKNARDKRPGWACLIGRCKGAERIKRIIDKKQLRFFCVPRKWIYPLPLESFPQDAQRGSHQPVILLETDMKLVSKEEIKTAWLSKITQRHLEELYYILCHGVGSTSLLKNVPFTKTGKFAFIDTEYPRKTPRYDYVRPYLSPEMQNYWDTLVRSGGQAVKRKINSY